MSVYNITWLKKCFFNAKWWRYHPQAFARFAALKASECLSLDEWQEKHGKDGQP